MRKGSPSKCCKLPVGEIDKKSCHICVGIERRFGCDFSPVLECVFATHAKFVFARQAGLGSAPRMRNSNIGHLRLLCESILCFVSFVFRLQRGWCTSRAQTLKFLAQSFDSHRIDP